ncbi:MAG: hypothetical protein CVV41_06880 [Candidatus Riflebacteria bacterium HGW-Riflebacteria-1]|jgi:hypothetical protein|nr:MAG: hypothetical protein CVV41_06880 [Candidatus Riflebacteria bacterium HGW-Riflebacteria-1]
MTSDELVSAIDPFSKSSEHLLVVIFTKSSSINFPLALNIAEGANRFVTADIKGKPTYFVQFAKSNDDAGRAVALLDLVKDWKGVQIFSRGRLLASVFTVNMVLNCFINSLSCRDYTAHCHEIIDDPFREDVRSSGLSLSINLVTKPPIKQKVVIDRFSFPCKHLYFHFRFQKDHPASLPDQIQAGAVNYGCDWCPNFSPDNWKKVGEKELFKDFFE